MSAEKPAETPPAEDTEAEKPPEKSGKKNELSLYVRIAHTYATNLANVKDRVRALHWIKKISSEQDEGLKKTQLKAIQLLILTLSRKRLVEPFTLKADKPLGEYEWQSYQPIDIAALIVQAERDELGKPTIKIDVTGDLCEIVTYQEIPFFGAHFFYAYSPESILNWTNLHKNLIPNSLLLQRTIESPNASLLNKALEETIYERVHRAPPFYEDPNIAFQNKRFADVSVLDRTGTIKEHFLYEQPCLENVLDIATVQDALEKDFLTSDEILPDRDMLTNYGEIIEKDHLEKVKFMIGDKSRTSVREKGNKRFNSKPMTENDILRAREEMLSRLPLTLQKRLYDQLTPSECSPSRNIESPGERKPSSKSLDSTAKKSGMACQKKDSTKTYGSSQMSTSSSRRSPSSLRGSSPGSCRQKASTQRSSSPGSCPQPASSRRSASQGSWPQQATPQKRSVSGSFSQQTSPRKSSSSQQRSSGKSPCPGSSPQQTSQGKNECKGKSPQRTSPQKSTCPGRGPPEVSQRKSPCPGSGAPQPRSQESPASKSSGRQRKTKQNDYKSLNFTPEQIQNLSPANQKRISYLKKLDEINISLKKHRRILFDNLKRGMSTEEDHFRDFLESQNISKYDENANKNNSNSSEEDETEDTTLIKDELSAARKSLIAELSSSGILSKKKGGNPKMNFSQTVIEKESYQPSSCGKPSQRFQYEIGERSIQFPGQQPLVQQYIKSVDSTCDFNDLVKQKVKSPDCSLKRYKENLAHLEKMVNDEQLKNDQTELRNNVRRAAAASRNRSMSQARSRSKSPCKSKPDNNIEQLAQYNDQLIDKLIANVSPEEYGNPINQVNPNNKRRTEKSNANEIGEKSAIDYPTCLNRLRSLRSGDKSANGADGNQQYARQKPPANKTSTAPGTPTHCILPPPSQRNHPFDNFSESNASYLDNTSKGAVGTMNLALQELKGREIFVKKSELSRPRVGNTQTSAMDPIAFNARKSSQLGEENKCVPQKLHTKKMRTGSFGNDGSMVLSNSTMMYEQEGVKDITSKVNELIQKHNDRLSKNESKYVVVNDPSIDPSKSNAANCNQK